MNTSWLTSLLFILLIVFTLPLFAHDAYDAYDAYEPEPTSLDWQTGSLWNEDKAIRVRFRAEHSPPSSALYSDKTIGNGEISEQIHVKGSPFQRFTVCARQIEAEGTEILGSYSQANTGQNSTHWIRLEETEASLTLTGSHRCSESTVAGLDTQLRHQAHYQWQNALISNAPFLVRYTKDKNTKVRKQRRKPASPFSLPISLFPGNEPASYETGGGSWDTDDHDPFTKRPPFFPMQLSGDFSITLLPILRLVSNWQQYLPGTQSLHWLLGEPDQSAGLILQLRFDDQSPVVLYISQAEFGELSEHLLSTRQLLHWLAPKLNGRAAFVQQLLELSESMAETTVWPEETLQSIQQQLAIILEQPDTEFTLAFEYQDLAHRLSGSLPPGSTQLGKNLPKTTQPKTTQPKTTGASTKEQTHTGRTAGGGSSNSQKQSNQLYPDLNESYDEIGEDEMADSPHQYTVKIQQTEFTLNRQEVLRNLQRLISQVDLRLKCLDCSEGGIALANMPDHAKKHCLTCDQCQRFAPGVGTLEARIRTLRFHTQSQCQDYQGEVFEQPLMDESLTTLRFMFRFGTEETLLDLLQVPDLVINESHLQQCDRYGRTLLHDLALHPSAPVISDFFRRFKSTIKPEHLQIQDNHIGTPLHYLFQIQPEDVILTTVDNIGELITSQTLTLQNHRGETLLHILYYRDFRQAINRLLSQHIGEGESLRHLLPLDDNNGVTLAHIVFDSGSSLLTSEILAMPNHKGETPVDILFQKGSVNTMKRFIKACSEHPTGDILGKQDETNGNTSLHALLARADPTLIKTIQHDTAITISPELTPDSNGDNQLHHLFRDFSKEDIIKAIMQNTKTITTAMLAAPNNKGITSFQILILREIKPQNLFTWLLRSMSIVAVNELLDKIDPDKTTWDELYKALDSLSAPAKADEAVMQLLDLMRPCFSSAAQQHGAGASTSAVKAIHQCPICKEEMDCSVAFPCCGFMLHPQCARTCLKETPNCPGCRHSATPTGLSKAALPRIEFEPVSPPVVPAPEPESPLQRAVKNGEIKKIHRLIDSGVDLLTEDAMGLTPLHYVMEHFSYDQLKAFWQQCSGWLKPKLLSTNTGAQGSPIDRLKQRQNLPEAIIQPFIDRATLQLPEDINEQDKVGETILHRVARKGDTTTVKDLIQWGAQVNKAKDGGFTPLYIATQNGHTATAEMLILLGAQVDKAERYGATPLYIAAQNGRTATAEMLIKRGAQVNKAKLGGFTPLHIAAQNGHTATAEMLIKHGAQVDNAMSGGFTPLYIAAQNGHTATAEMLIKHGAQVDKANKEGATPLYIAAREGHTATAEMLIQRRAQVDKADIVGITPLIILCEKFKETDLQAFYNRHKGKLTQHNLTQKGLGGRSAIETLSDRDDIYLPTLQLFLDIAAPPESARSDTQ